MFRSFQQLRDVSQKSTNRPLGKLHGNRTRLQVARFWPTCVRAGPTLHLMNAGLQSSCSSRFEVPRFVHFSSTRCPHYNQNQSNIYPPKHNQILFGFNQIATLIWRKIILPLPPLLSYIPDFFFFFFSVESF